MNGKLALSLTAQGGCSRETLCQDSYYPYLHNLLNLPWFFSQKTRERIQAVTYGAYLGIRGARMSEEGEAIVWSLMTVVMFVWMHTYIIVPDLIVSYCKLHYKA